METKRCPMATEKKEAGHLLQQIVQDIQMNMLDTPHVYSVERPYHNEGLTAIVPIQTSHIAFHFWRNPERIILKSTDSNCLLEFDLYTCGTLSAHQIRRVLHHLTIYGPTHVDLTLLNRKWSLSIDRHARWSAQDSIPWPQWIDSIL